MKTITLICMGLLTLFLATPAHSYDEENEMVEREIAEQETAERDDQEREVPVIVDGVKDAIEDRWHRFLTFALNKLTGGTAKAQREKHRIQNKHNQDQFNVLFKALYTK
ncbi:hypothetical protein HHUSO_G2237 [Huso huso]|uniref:Uncharacterized protein n=1 Tax=Huso huso TaxID=61971 RepID=A0ABR1A6W4_HUSHU